MKVYQGMQCVVSYGSDVVEYATPGDDNGWLTSDLRGSGLEWQYHCSRHRAHLEEVPAVQYRRGFSGHWTEWTASEG